MAQKPWIEMTSANTPEKRCRDCGVILSPGRYNKQFCDRKCKDRWFRRAQVRGGQVYSLLIAWRETRGTKKGVLGDIAWIVDSWRREDEERIKDA